MVYRPESVGARHKFGLFIRIAASGLAMVACGKTTVDTTFKFAVSCPTSYAPEVEHVTDHHKMSDGDDTTLTVALTCASADDSQHNRRPELRFDPSENDGGGTLASRHEMVADLPVGDQMWGVALTVDDEVSGFGTSKGPSFETGTGPVSTAEINFKNALDLSRVVISDQPIATAEEYETSH